MHKSIIYTFMTLLVAFCTFGFITSDNEIVKSDKFKSPTEVVTDKGIDYADLDWNVPTTFKENGDYVVFAKFKDEPGKAIGILYDKGDNFILEEVFFYDCQDTHCWDGTCQNGNAVWKVFAGINLGCTMICGDCSSGDDDGPGPNPSGMAPDESPLKNLKTKKLKHRN